MKQFHAVKAVFFVVSIGSAIGSRVKADDWNRNSVITCSAPLEIPGVHPAGWGVLPAGTYVVQPLAQVEKPSLPDTASSLPCSPSSGCWRWEAP